MTRNIKAPAPARSLPSQPRIARVLPKKLCPNQDHNNDTRYRWQATQWLLLTYSHVSFTSYLRSNVLIRSIEIDFACCSWVNASLIFSMMFEIICLTCYLRYVFLKALTKIHFWNCWQQPERWFTGRGRACEALRARTVSWAALGRLGRPWTWISQSLKMVHR